MSLSLKTYRDAVQLEETFDVSDCVPVTEEQISRLIDRLLKVLLNEVGHPVPNVSKDKRLLLQSLLTVRPPHPLPDQFWADMDRLQACEARQKTITDGKII